MTLTPPSAAASASGQRLRPAAFTAPVPTPALASVAVRPSPLGAPPVSRALSQPRAAGTESENSACEFSLSPRRMDGILDFSMDSVFLAAFRVGTDFHRNSSTDTVFSVPVGNAAQRLFDRARLPLHIHFNTMRVQKLANHLLVVPNQT